MKTYEVGRVFNLLKDIKFWDCTDCIKGKVPEENKIVIQCYSQQSWSLEIIKKVSKVKKLVKSIVHDSKKYVQNKIACQLVITIVDKYTQFIVKE